MPPITDHYAAPSCPIRPLLSLDVEAGRLRGRYSATSNSVEPNSSSSRRRYDMCFSRWYGEQSSTDLDGPIYRQSYRRSVGRGDGRPAARLHGTSTSKNYRMLRQPLSFVLYAANNKTRRSEISGRRQPSRRSVSVPTRTDATASVTQSQSASVDHRKATLRSAAGLTETSHNTGGPRCLFLSVLHRFRELYPVTQVTRSPADPSRVDCGTAGY